MESRVSELTLDVRGVAADATTLGASAEAFARQALERCDALLERRAPGRVLVLRELELSVRLRSTDLEDPRELEAVAAAIADDLEERAARGDDAAAFAGDLAWRAAHLDAWAHGTNAGDWRFAALDADGEPWKSFDPPIAALRLTGIFCLLRDEGRLAAVVKAMPEPSLEAIVSALSSAGRHDDDLSPQDPGAVFRIDAATGRERLEHRLLQLVESVRRAAAGAEDAIARGDSTAPVEADLHDELLASITSVDTEFGGVWYLVPLMLELGIGEALWQACLPEGFLLADALAHLLGPDAAADPVVPAITGVAPATTDVDVIQVQQREVAFALAAEWRQAMTRHGFSSAISARLDRVGTAQRRWLTVSTTPHRHVLLVLDASARAALAEALDSVHELWPAATSWLVASPALTAADARGRFRLASAEDSAVSAWPSDTDVSDRHAISLQIAGSLAALFAHRLGVDDWKAHLRVPARIVTSASRIDVHMPMVTIDLDVRRAGLDRDPGMVPWLGRELRFVFDEA